MGAARFAVIPGRSTCLNAIRRQKAERGEQQPENQPEEVERKPPDHGMNAVPERNGKAGRDKGNEAEENRSVRRTPHAKNHPDGRNRGIVAEDGRPRSRFPFRGLTGSLRAAVGNYEPKGHPGYPSRLCLCVPLGLSTSRETPPSSTVARPARINHPQNR